MKKYTFFNLVFTLFLLLLFSCSSTHKTHEAKIKEVESTKTAEAVAKTHGSYYTILEFDKGTTTLNESNKKALKEFIKKAEQDGRDLDQIKILSWADREYPDKAAVVSAADIKVANNRTESIEKYFKNVLDVNPGFATYNMAKRPSKISELLHTDDYKTKNIFLKTGAMPSSAKQGDLATLMNRKARKALIMVEYQ